MNYLTRMRLTDAEGRLEYSFKDSLDDPMPEGLSLGLNLNRKLQQPIKLYLDTGPLYRVKPFLGEFRMSMAAVSGVIS